MAVNVYKYFEMILFHLRKNYKHWGIDRPSMVHFIQLKQNLDLYLSIYGYMRLRQRKCGKVGIDR